MSYRSELLRILDARGYIHQLTDAAGLDALAARERIFHRTEQSFDRLLGFHLRNARAIGDAVDDV